MSPRSMLRALEGRRVRGRFPCVYCHSYDFVLRRHWCVDEVELYCDGCERWTGDRISIADVTDRTPALATTPVIITPISKNDGDRRQTQNPAHFDRESDGTGDDGRRSPICGICSGTPTLAGWRLRKRLRSCAARIAANMKEPLTSILK
jgi:hypothetical protein